MKWLDTPTLAWLNEQAIKRGLNRSLTDEFFEKVDPEGRHLVAFSMVHNDSEIRAHILAKMEGTTKPTEVWLDILIHNFNKLPDVEKVWAGEELKLG